MALDAILRRTFDEPDRAEVQARVIAEVEADPERFIAAYVANPDSFAGRYVSADLFKETLPIYSAGREAAGRYNAAVHNTAATLSAEQFRRTLAGTGEEGIFLTGVPGSGKTTTVLTSGTLSERVRFVFEGQLSRPATGIEKIEAALRVGVQPFIVAVLAKPEEALRNTFGRFEAIGRGASIDLMADIAGNLPAGLTAIRDRFGDDVQLRVVDVRDRSVEKSDIGWAAIEVLREEGNRDQIIERLRSELERNGRARTIGLDTIAQANGQAPFERYRWLDSPSLRGVSQDGDGPGLSPGDTEPGFVAAEGNALLATAEAGDREAEQIGAAQPVDQRWTEALNAAVEAKDEQADRLEDRLETMIEAQEVRISAAQAAQPGLFAMPGQRAKAQKQLADAQAAKATLTARLERVREIRQEPDPDHPHSVQALARAKLTRDEPALFDELTASRVAQTMREQEARRTKQQAEGASLGRGRSLGQRQSPS